MQFIGNILGSSTVVSVVVSIAVAGAVFVYLRARIAELERLHIEQARILRSFIAHQQQMFIQGGTGADRAAADAKEPASESAPSTIANGATPLPPATPRDKVVVSDEDSESYTDSSDDTNSTSSDAHNVTQMVQDRFEHQPLNTPSGISLLPLQTSIRHQRRKTEMNIV